ncbi:pyruvate kinase-like protein [Microdochium bolleyi]|uniref:Pyruvate kinase-like protein n=1 Tax=Microdochium bolleyi TaxID=196109 RepID=A0A136J189_9PEZI|nr:pyruvate kinase-like protein [Microdochium bolleyi]
MEDKSGSADLSAPFERDIILEVRSSKMKAMPGLTIQSGIDKQPRTGRVPVSTLGLDADEHDMIFHGGIDKAVHGYCSSHYPSWQREYPDAADRFRPGAFGENLVTAHMNERNVCIGDILSVGTGGLVLQVSLPRQPCFKLNHRFQLRNFAPVTYKLSRTGWYYRVLEEGSVQAGDEIRLKERRWPGWTIERVQEYLHRNQDDAAMNAELAGVTDMGAESRGAFQSRVAKLEARQKREALGLDAKPVEKWHKYKLVEKRKETPRISAFVFEALEQDPETKAAAYGSHIRFRLPGSGLLRSYSIVEGNANRFELGIALEQPSRGGSAYFHGTLEVGDVVEAARPTTDCKPAGSKSSHVFIVGGIGITAFLKLIEGYQGIHWNTVVHYAVRSGEEVPFRSRIEAVGEDALRVYDASKGERMDIAEIVGGLTWNSHLYVCGPRRMMDEARRAVAAAGLGEDDVHFEAFAADTNGDPFEVEIANRDSRVLQVGSEETLLEVLKRDLGGDVVESSCEVGNCGTCKIALKSGSVDHRGTALLGDEKKTSILSCVSRGIGRIAIEI